MNIFSNDDNYQLNLTYNLGEIYKLPLVENNKFSVVFPKELTNIITETEWKIIINSLNDFVKNLDTLYNYFKYTLPYSVSSSLFGIFADTLLLYTGFPTGFFTFVFSVCGGVIGSRYYNDKNNYDLNSYLDNLNNDLSNKGIMFRYHEDIGLYIRFF